MYIKHACPVRNLFSVLMHMFSLPVQYITMYTTDGFRPSFDGCKHEYVQQTLALPVFPFSDFTKLRVLWEFTVKPNVSFIRQLITPLVTVDEVVVVPLFGLRYTALSHHTANIDQGHVSGVFIAFDLRYQRF